MLSSPDSKHTRLTSPHPKNVCMLQLLQSYCTLPFTAPWRFTGYKCIQR
jgi:hypothetical protein